MSLILRNLQSVIPIRRVPLRARIELLRHILGIRQFDLGVICVDNRGIQRLNRTYRKSPSPTDVLSFPFHENLRAGAVPQPECPDDFNLGDIFLGVEYIFGQCQENSENYYDVLTVTVAHGLCHLLGYKHSTAAEWHEMYHKEKVTLEALNEVTGTSLQPLTKNLFG